MIVTFEKEYLRDLYETGETMDKKHRFQSDVTARYVARIKTLQKTHRIEDLFVINSLNYEVLKGNKQGISSIRVNKQYCIEFTVKDNEVEPIVTVCNILELSNHYK
ncbi:MAG: type II toxin-antitoxin system RelE/ParE family toxin [Candidatus Azobacteroides sp.]|nr:type II toxin-antitoxin system RelE/ParE family toxin [Candidatus Azobacteroides sp.]